MHGGSAYLILQATFGILLILVVLPETFCNGDVTETFSGWDKWKERYSGCDPEENLNTSPISLSRDGAKENSNIRPIVVYSGAPVHNCYSLAILHKGGLVNTEVVNIVPRPECRTTITHISGAGERVRDKRYFHRALLFFTRSEVSMPQSLHQIDGETFQMEVSIEFGDSFQQGSTELHVLVKANPPDEAPENPVFKPLQEAIVDLKKKLASEFSADSERGKKLKVLEDNCTEAKNNANEVMKEIKDFDTYAERIKSLQEIADDIGGITDKGYLDLVKLTTPKDKNNTKHKIERYEEKIQTLEARLKDLTDLFTDYNGDVERDLRKLILDTKLKILYYSRKLELAREGKTTALHLHDSPHHKLSLATKALKRNKIGIPGGNPYSGQVFKSPDDVHAKLAALQISYEKVRGVRRMKVAACKKYDEFSDEVTYATVPIKMAFQISWLFPMSGGFYIYKGSNPIPPCEKRKHSVVFEEPIEMTTEQLEAFQSLPSLTALMMASKEGKPVNADAEDFDENLRVDKMIPVMVGNKNREVSFVRKNTVYLAEDAVHRKARRKDDGAEVDDDNLISDEMSSADSKREHFYCLNWGIVLCSLVNLMLQFPL